MNSSPLRPTGTGRRSWSRMWQVTLSAGLPMGSRWGARVAEGVRVIRRGSRGHGGLGRAVEVDQRDARQGAEQVLGEGAGQRLTAREDPRECGAGVSSPLSTRARSSVGTPWRALTPCSRIMAMMLRGSRNDPGGLMTIRAPAAQARTSHCAASKLIGVFCRTDTSGPRYPQRSSHRTCATMRPVFDHHALGAALAARGVDDVRQVVLLCLGQRMAAARGRGRHGDHHGPLGTRPREAVAQVGTWRSTDLDTRVGGHVTQPRIRIVGREREIGGAGREDAPHARHQVGGGLHEEPDTGVGETPMPTEVELTRSAPAPPALRS
ncbi:hypothetical protein SMICM17S_12333 [Streptomyces microflavus]